MKNLRVSKQTSQKFHNSVLNIQVISRFLHVLVGPLGSQSQIQMLLGDIQSAVNAAVAASTPQKRLSTDHRGRIQLEQATSSTH